MTLLISYLALSINLLNLVDKPIKFDSSKDQVYVIISDASCHDCLEHTEQWVSQSEIDMTAVIWYNKTIVQKKEQMAFYKKYITPKTWAF